MLATPMSPSSGGAVAGGGGGAGLDRELDMALTEVEMQRQWAASTACVGYAVGIRAGTVEGDQVIRWPGEYLVNIGEGRRTA